MTVGADGYTIYFGSDSRYLYALNQYGQLKWRFADGSQVDGGFTLAPDGALYIGSDSSKVRKFLPGHVQTTCTSWNFVELTTP